MEPKTLHIFNDKAGYYTQRITNLLTELSLQQSSIIINLNPAAKTDPIVSNYKSARHFIEKTNFDISKIVFHSFSVENINDFRYLKKRYPKSKFIWSFWSHEYYQEFPRLKHLYDRHTKYYYYRKIISLRGNYLLSFFQGKVPKPFYFLNSGYDQYFSQFNDFCSFIKGDYDRVMQEQKTVGYLQVAYLSLDDFPEIACDFTSHSNAVIVGHSGAPILNHQTILDKLNAFGYQGKVIVPLSYGKKSYIKSLKKKIKNYSKLDIEIITKFLPSNEFYEKVSKAEYFILNAYCQQALGNIVFFLLVGVKIFLSSKSTTYHTLLEQGFFIHNIEEELNIDNMQPLSVSEKTSNRKLIKEILAKDNVRKQWMKLLSEDSQ